MNPYRKRAKGSWRSGKGAKLQSNREERQFSKREVQEALESAEEDYLQKYHKGARSRNEKARLEYRIQWYERRAKEWEIRGASDSMMHYFRSQLTKAKKDLDTFIAKRAFAYES